MTNLIYPYIDKIVLFGPYIGDWKEEILSFRPLVNWIYSNVEFADYYLSTHFNRAFLYDFIDDSRFIPVYESLSRDEHKQKNAIHKDIKTKDYSSIILKNIRDNISIETGYLKRDIVQYSLSYIKSVQNFSILNKKFSKISYNQDEEKQKIVFIPDKKSKRRTLEEIANHLDKYYKNEYVIVGDDKIRLKGENVIKKRIDYFESVYQLLIDYISNARLVICPCSHWTVIANQQGTYVLSWGSENIAQYKTDGIYGFNNENSIIGLQKNMVNGKILNHVDKTIEYINKGEK